MLTKFMKHVLREGATGADGGAGGAGGDPSATGNSGGASGGEGGGNGGGSGDGGGSVSRAEFERIQAELNKHKSTAQKLKEQLDADKTNKMKEQNQWKELAEAKERELAEEREKAERLQNSYLDEKKYTAVQAACQKLGLRAEALSDLEMLDLEQVQIETTNTGKINVLGAERFAERLKSLKPHWFATQTAPSVNTNGTRVLDSGGAITPKMLLDAEKEGRKSGDMSKYQTLFKSYQTQRAAQSRR